MGREGDGNTSLHVVPAAWDHKGQSLLQRSAGITRGDSAGHPQGPIFPGGTHLWEMPCALWKACLKPKKVFQRWDEGLGPGMGKPPPSIGLHQGWQAVQGAACWCWGSWHPRAEPPPLSHTSTARTNPRRSPRHCTPSVFLSSCRAWERLLLSVPTRVAGQR